MLKISVASLLTLMFSATVVAQTPSPPSRKPPASYASNVVSPTDAALIQAGIREAKAYNWRATERIWRQIDDPVGKDLILWFLATSQSDSISFEILDTAVQRLKAWPDYDRRIRRAAEEAIYESALSDRERIDWLTRDGLPQYGIGKLALAEAYLSTGSAGRGEVLIIDVWENHVLPRQVAQNVMRRHRSILNRDHHWARANLMMWIGQRTAARDLRNQLSSGQRALIDARYALAARQRGVDGRINAVPGSLQSEAGLLFERARWRRRARTGTATELLVQINGFDVPEEARDILWRERHLALRVALKERRYETAYRLAAPHGMNRGTAFAEAEWIAGWIALRFLDRPAEALEHFESLEAGVSTPISLARAQYWKGRALEDLGRAADADAAYLAASAHIQTYYGQLAAERIGQTEIAFSAIGVPTPTQREAFESRPLVQAIRLLAEAGEARRARRFSYHLDNSLASPVDAVLLLELGQSLHMPDLGVRGGKEGLAYGVFAPEAAYPVISYPLVTQPRVETAYVLALSRQETELNPRAVSGANARGLMQLLPSTARTQARREGLPYRASWLTDDPAYNMSLGAAHLDDLLDRFNGSYIMAAAAYNAGAGRPARWIREYGDPRTGAIDPVDWVELIPFSETRNYVQRILENTQVYRHRLANAPHPVQLTQDLYRGASGRLLSSTSCQTVPLPQNCG